MVLKPFHSDAVVTEFISTRTRLPHALSCLSRNAASAVLQPMQMSALCCSWCPLVGTSLSTVCHQDQLCSCSSREGWAHLPASRGSGCRKGESVSSERSGLIFGSAQKYHCSKHSSGSMDLWVTHSSALPLTTWLADCFGEPTFRWVVWLQGEDRNRVSELSYLE